MLGGEERERAVTLQMIRSSPSSDKKDVKTNIKCHSTSTSRKIVPGFVTKLCSALKIIEDYDDGVNNSPNGEDYDEDNFDECV